MKKSKDFFVPNKEYEGVYKQCKEYLHAITKLDLKETMPMANRLTNRDIEPNKIVFVNGKLFYSRIVAPIAGEELKTENKRREEKGLVAYKNPFTQAVVKDAKVILSDPDTGETINEQFIAQSFKTAKDGRPMFFAINKWENIPFIAEYKAETGEVTKIDNPKSDIAPGLDVTLVMRSYKGKMGNNGFVLDGLIVNDKVQYVEDGFNDFTDKGSIFSQYKNAMNRKVG